MLRSLLKAIIIWNIAIIQAKEPELPPCPTNMQYFPQNLPMHCRMPAGSPPRILQNPLEKQQPLPISMPGFPNIPGMPGLPGSIPTGISGAMPGGMPMPMQMLPMPSAPAQKLPVIVMPFYSQDTSAKTALSQPRPPRYKKHKSSHIKKRPKHYYSDEDTSDTDTSTDDSSDTSDGGWWKESRQGRRNNRHRSKRRRQQNQALLTPVLQYVTKDGYVIYEKQISKGEAKDWLGNKNDNRNEVETVTNKHEYELESHEPKNEVDTRFLMKEEEGAEVTTEARKEPQAVHKKRHSKRKLPKK